jgi:peptide/nickel transport system ATP-binding protein
VLRAARHPYTAALASAFPTIGDPASRFAPVGLAGDPPDPSELPTGCSFHPRCTQRVEGCSTVSIQLRPSLGLHRAACVLVRADS